MVVMVNRVLKYLVSFVIIGVIISSCSTKKNTMMTRNYHNLTSHYNIYFNAYETFREGLKKVDLMYQDDFNNIIPITIYSQDAVSNRLRSDMEKTKKKTSKLITTHSIQTKPKSKKGFKSDRQKAFSRKKEFNKWVDDSYFLMGKAYYYQHDFFPAIQNFEFVIRQYPDDGLKEEATLWLGKTHLELKNYSQAKDIFDRLEAEPDLPKNISSELPASMADWHFRQDQIPETIAYLSEAAELTNSKKLKTRYYYILGQLFEKEEDFTQASIKYGEVLELKPSYRMEFNAKINRARLYQGGGDDGKEIRRQLERMLKDDKNLEFLDQVYYALAEIDMKENNISDAIENYRLSTQYSFTNLHQKALSYLALGKIYYEEPDYIESSTFYDSCVLAMPEGFPDYEDIKDHAYGLSLLADNLKVIKREDSLLQVAALPSDELEALIAEKIEEAKKIEEEMRRLEEEERFSQRNNTYRRYGQGGRNLSMAPGSMNMGGGFGPQSLGGGNMGASGMGSSMAGMSGGSGQWYFYNPTTLSFGESEFIKRFGRRKLEDNWRRENKNIASATDDISTEGEEGDIQAVTTESKAKSFQPTTRDYYVADLPLTDSAKVESNKRIETAIFNVGKIFADELDKPKESIDYFLMLNERYPETEKLLFSYYNLYQIYKAEPNPEQETVYKDLILSKFPESRSALIIKNPNYFQEIEVARQEVKDYYIGTYRAYLDQQYEQVIENCLHADTGFLLNPIRDKFGLLQVMASAKIQPDNEEYLMEELKSLVFKFPESEVVDPAKNLINYLENGPSDSVKTGVRSGLRIGTVDANAEDTEDANYLYNENSIHYYIVIVASNTSDVNRLKYNISSYNVEKYDQDFFEVKSEILAENLIMISVKNFPDAKSGLDYYAGLAADPEVYADYEETDFRHFVISKANFNIFFKNKNVFNYIRFFNENYLNQEN